MDETRTFAPPADPNATIGAPNAIPDDEALPAIAGYEILERIGRGGMGAVYRARQLALNRVVALKVVLSGAHASRGEISRFLGEAEAIAGLQHPNVVQIYEVGKSSSGAGAEFPYLALEYCPGGSLSNRLKGTPLLADESALLIEQLARAVDAVHRAGLVHRDLKPSNVLFQIADVSPTDESVDGMIEPSVRASALLSAGSMQAAIPKIADFGLARRTESDSGLTATGAVLGTPSYMSPEQAAGGTKFVGPPADVYALGAILYECLTGRPPFTGPTPMDTIMQVMDAEPVAPSRLVTKLPVDLETIVLKCLEKNPAKRYKSAAGLADDLRRFRDGESISARPAGTVERAVKWARRRPTAAGLLALSLITAIGVTAGSVWFSAQLREERDFAFEQQRLKNIEAEKAKEQEQQVRVEQERTRRTLAYSNLLLAQNKWAAGAAATAQQFLAGIPEDLRGWEWRFLKRKFAAGDLVLHGHPNSLTNACFDPAGKWIATSGDDSFITIWDAATGMPVRTIEQAGVREIKLAFSPTTGHLFATSWGVDLSEFDPATGELLRRISSRQPRFGYADTVRVACSADGRWVVHSGSGIVEVRNAVSGEIVARFIAADGQSMALAFSPDGTKIAAQVGSPSIWANLPAALARANARDALLRPPPFNGVIHVWDIAGKKELWQRPGFADAGSMFDWSPDGRFMVVGRKRKGIIELIDPENGRTLRSVAGPSELECLRFRPDGRVLAASTERGGIHLFDIETLQLLTVLHGHDGLTRASGIVDIQFSPDGQRMIAAGADGSAHIWNADSAGGASYVRGRASTGGVWICQPSGRLLCVNRGGGVSDLEITTGALRERTHIPMDRPMQLVLTPNGKELFGWFGQSIRKYDLATGNMTPVTNQLPRPSSCLAVSSNGARFAAGSRDGAVTVGPPSPNAKLLELKNPLLEDAEEFVKKMEAARFDFRKIGELLNNSPKMRMAFQYMNNDLMQITCAAVSDRGMVAAGCFFGVAVWTKLDQPPELIAMESESRPRIILFHPKEKTVAIGSVDGTVTLFDLATRKRIDCPNSSPVSSMAYTDDGSRLAVAYDDGDVKLWQGESGQELTTLKCPAGAPLALRFTCNGDRLLAELPEGAFYQWHAPAVLHGLTDRVAADSSRDHNDAAPVVVRQTDRQVMVMPLPGKRRPPTKIGLEGSFISKGSRNSKTERPLTVDVQLPAEVIAERRLQAQSIPEWHANELAAAAKAGDAFAVRFHTRWLVAAQPLPFVLGMPLGLPLLH